MDRKSILRFLSVNFENLVGCLLIYIIYFRFSTNKLDYFTLNIHPLAIFIAIQATRYGLQKSSTVVLYAMFFYVYPYYELGYDVGIFFSVYKYYKFLIMFIIINFFLGRIRDNYNFKFQVVVDEKENDEIQLQKAIKINEDLRKINEILKGRIINSRESILNLHNIEKTLKENSNSFIEKSIELLASYIHGERVVVYKYNKEMNNLEVLEKIGEVQYLLRDDKEGLEKISTKKEINLEKIDKQGNKEYIGALYNDREELELIYHIEKFQYNYKDSYEYDLFILIMEKIQEIYKGR